LKRAPKRPIGEGKREPALRGEVCDIENRTRFEKEEVLLLPGKGVIK